MNSILICKTERGRFAACGRLPILALSGLLLLGLFPAARAEEDGRIRPFDANPRYWQYQGEPVLLLGGSKDDNLFQVPDLREHLDDLQAAGGNVIRNTMSDRKDRGHEVYAFGQRPDGRFDLDRWNDEYWRRFANMLKWTHERNIIVQIEVWDRFDHSRENWIGHPFNPANNVNYTHEATGLAARYPSHPSRDEQPFYHTVPGMPLYHDGLEIVRDDQERFVSKMLEHTLEYPHVLYCMDNETSTPMAWGRSWMAFIEEKAAERGVEVFVTDMFDDVWKPEQSEFLPEAVERADLYEFLDISQINSRNFGQDHWDRLMFIVELVEPKPRPLNNTKIYSAGETSFGSGTPKDGVERFWRNLIGGAASCRFHRPTSGIGLNEIAVACIRSAREAEALVPFWTVEPAMDRLGDREENEAYLAAAPGRAYVLFFTDGGSVTLDLEDAPETFEGTWIDVSSGERTGSISLDGGSAAGIEAPGPGPWVLALEAAD